ncbi:hypothetical protein [Microbispora bryophytorum]|uniref:hypothetical protein n=1 Tax=Microbispora bryophytorum TaxID=1460882 RepID=UPI00115A7AE2|nr:hypothetical protein [Microbispora bryophytorum]MBD3139539.1 hypothetical protein [Microbispora bryophytorum]TQS02837.1 hypothetical protein FLX07_26225 [Microbispora bryophytorum]
MARLLRHLDDELYVQYGALCIYGTPDVPELRDEESEALHYTAALHLQAWDAEPPAPGTSWRLIEQRNFTAETGVIQIGVVEDSGREFLIGPPLFEYGLTVHVDVPDDGRWLFRFWPIRDVFDPLVHMKPREPIGSTSPLEPRPVPVPVTTAGQWAAMRPDKFRRSEGGVRWVAMPPGLPWADPVADALNPDNAPTFLIPYQEQHVPDLRTKEPGGTYRMWRWERQTADGNPEDGNLLTGRIVHVRDSLSRRVFASGIVTMLGMDDGRCLVRDAEPHEAARVLCSEETWPD